MLPVAQVVIDSVMLSPIQLRQSGVPVYCEINTQAAGFANLKQAPICGQYIDFYGGSCYTERQLVVLIMKTILKHRQATFQVLHQQIPG